MNSLRALTTRGRCFIAAGLTTAACAFLLGERDLLRVAVLIVALPLISAAVVSRTRYRLSCSRSLGPRRLAAGHTAEVLIRMENVSRLPSGLILIEEELPYVLGERPRFVLDRVEPRGVRELAYRIRPETRGRFRIGPLGIRITDPFGLVELRRTFQSVDTLVVTPQIVALPPVRLHGDWAGGGDGRTRSLATAGDDDVAPREYRHGDDLRRVHWRSTARHGELMVRREEQQWRSRGGVLLDTRRVAHAGEGPGSSFETAVSAAASIAVHLIHEGFGIRFATDAGRTEGETTEDALLDLLAGVRPSRAVSLQRGVDAIGHRDGLVVAVLGDLSPEECDRLARAHRGTGTWLALLLDPYAWGRTGRAGAADANAKRLRATGWTALTLAPDDGLASLWRDAAPVTRSRTAGAIR